MASKSSDWRPGPTVCRCCLAEGCYKDISTEYFWMGKREVYAEMLLDALNLSIAYSQSGGPNSNSRLICELCITRLREASEFKRQVQECEKTFMQCLDPGAPNMTELDVTLENIDNSEVKVERVKLEKPVSDDDDFDDRPDFGDDDDDDLDDQPLTKFASKEPKKESVDILDLLDNSKAGVKRKSTSKTKTTPAKKVKLKEKPKKETVKPTTSKSKAPKPTIKLEKKKKGSAPAVTEPSVGITKRAYKPRKLKEVVGARQMSRRRRANNEVTPTSEKRMATVMMRENALTILEFSTAWPFRWFHGAFYCSYCQERHTDVDLLRDHVTKYHFNEKPTKSVFSKIIENNMLKIDVANLSCRLCQSNLETIDVLKHHLFDCHGRSLNSDYSDGVLPFKLGVNEFSCQKCFTVFDTFPKADQHMNTHYPNHICDECGKTFVSNTRFRHHMKSHEVGQFPCGECDAFFKTRAQRMTHRLRIHKNGIRYACPKCSQAFTTYYIRARHLVEEHGQQRIDYVCPACDRVFENGSKRAAHYRFTHANIEKKYNCTECPISFVTKWKLQRHAMTHLKKERAAIVS